MLRLEDAQASLMRRNGSILTRDIQHYPLNGVEVNIALRHDAA